MWRCVGLGLAVAAAGCARRDDGGIAACAEASQARRADAADLCAAAFAATRDPATGAAAARALAGQTGRTTDVEAIARAIGDAPGGADAWNGLGVARSADGDTPGAIAAYQRALDHRAPEDLRGRALDAVGLYDRYGARDDYANALRYAAIAYDAATRSGDAHLRGYVLVGVANLLVDTGDLGAAEALVTEADQVVEPARPEQAYLRQLHGLIDLAHGRARLARDELADAAAIAHRQGLPNVEEQATMHLINADLALGDADAAQRALDGWREVDGEAHAWHVRQAAMVALARGRAADAVALTDAALRGPHAGVDEVPGLEAVRGRALARLGRTADAEAALRRAIDAIDAERGDLDLDAMKPWLLDSRHEAFEDLFRIYVDEQRLADAFAIAQRANARSLVDGLVRASAAAPASIAQAGDRVTTLRALAHALRASAPAAPPTTDAIVRALAGRHVITYVRARDEVWAIALTGDGALRAARIGGVDELRARIDAWSAHPDQLADELGARLLPDAIAPPPGAPLYVIADPPVADVAFAALRKDDGWLVERNPIAYAPSAAVLALIAAAPARAGGAVVLGDPTGDLPAARREAREVAAALGASAKLGADATRAALFAGSGGALVHVAAHAAPTARGGALVLADGPLDAGEVVDHGGAASLVVLTSCTSADPSDRDELGPLASAFLAAGAHAVVAARWAVDDAGALDFARAFYAADGAHDPVRATAAAQRRLIAGGAPVTTWAPFVVIGASASPNASEQRP